VEGSGLTHAAKENDTSSREDEISEMSQRIRKQESLIENLRKENEELSKTIKAQAEKEEWRQKEEGHRKPKAGSTLKHILFFGNSGSGRSTILSGLIGGSESYCRSGVSFHGLTQEVQSWWIGDKVFIDMPSLDDSERSKQISKEIPGCCACYAFFFMIQLDAGRVRSSDKIAIQGVIGGLKHHSNFKYSIIVNKVPLQIFNQSQHKNDIIKILQEDLDVDPTRVHFIALQEKLEDEDNGMPELSKDFIEFIDNAPCIQPEISKDFI